MSDNKLIEEARKHLHYPGSPVDSWCMRCADDWPCVTRRLADALEAATEELERERRRGAARQRFVAETARHNEQLLAERDAAVAAVGRVRGVLSEWESRQERNREILGSGALGHFQAIDCTGDLRAALDGAPEPEEKP